MRTFYILGVDQSTQGTKGVLVDQAGRIASRADRPHRQIISGQGWVSHDPEEIYRNVLGVCGDVIRQSAVDPSDILCMGITNQRETTVAFSRTTGKPLAEAIVWQCARAAGITEKLRKRVGFEDTVRTKTGLMLSPYYPASKMAWLLQNRPEVEEAAGRGELALGTIDSYLVFRLTGGHRFCTDASNASRYQLMNLNTIGWDPALCAAFGIPETALPEIVGSDAAFGMTDLDGLLDSPIPIAGVLGDSHGALFGHGCLAPGMTKATYGTGSSVMMNIGPDIRLSTHGLSASVAWKMNGKVSYCLEGNINYSAAVISWLQKDVKLIESPAETDALARAANPEDTACLVPAVSGLGAPWWRNDARAVLCGMSRTTGKNEIVRAALDSIACQIFDVVEAMRLDTGLDIPCMSVDGGPTGNRYLMQTQSDLLRAEIRIPDAEELSVLGAVYTAGIASGFYDPARIHQAIHYRTYRPEMDETVRSEKLALWRQAVRMVLGTV